MKTERAAKACAEMMVKMLGLGFTKARLPALEKLFWRCRDHKTGKVKQAKK